MLVKTKLSESGMTQVMEQVNTQYEGNLQYRDYQAQGKTRDGLNKYRFTLRVASSRGPGMRRTQRGHRSVNASWEAHRDFYRALYDYDEQAKVQTSLITYQDRADFEARFGDTYYRNVGSIMFPAVLGEL